MAELPNGIGVTKTDYLAVLAETDRSIDLVVMESCKSRLDADLVAQIPSHVRRLFTAH